MDNYPNWAAPLLGLGGGAVGGLAIAGDPRRGFVPWQAALVGAVLGLLGGGIVWFTNRGTSSSKPRRKNPISGRPMGQSLVATPRSPVPQVQLSRGNALVFFAIGLAGLGLNHFLVSTASKKYFPLVLGGSVLAAIGLAGMIWPQVLQPRRSGEEVPWLSYVVAIVFGLAGFGVGFYLWLVVY